MIDYYKKLKTFFTKTENEVRLKELESVKNDQTKLIKLYNRFKSNLPMKVSEIKSIIKEEIRTILKEDKIPGGLAQGKTLKDISQKHFKDLSGYFLLKKSLEKGIEVEMEHTTDEKIAKEIAMDHLWEDPKYYDKLETIEKTK